MLKFVLVIIGAIVSQLSLAESYLISCRYEAVSSEPTAQCQKQSYRKTLPGSRLQMKKLHTEYVGQLNKPDVNCVTRDETDRLELRFETSCYDNKRITMYAFKTIWPRDRRARIYYRARKMPYVEHNMKNLIKIQNRYQGTRPKPESLYW